YSLLDGRNRLDAIEAAGLIGDGPLKSPLLLIEQRLAEVNSARDPYDYVISANIHRRHLTADDKRRLIAAVLKATPEKSNRQVAATVKADHKTVAAVRAEKEATGEIPQLKKTVGKDGRARPKIRVMQEAAQRRKDAPKIAEYDGQMAER